jgi:DNA-binding response OmpR family regulator
VGVDPERRVLIVDDEHSIADTLVAIFLMQGYAARAAYSAEEALALIAEWNPELAILDVYLPGMNGIDLAVLLKAQYPKCGLLLFSGASETSELMESARLVGHPFDVLAKPLPPADLLSRAAHFFPSKMGPSALPPEAV